MFLDKSKFTKVEAYILGGGAMSGEIKEAYYILGAAMSGKVKIHIAEKAYILGSSHVSGQLQNSHR